MDCREAQLIMAVYIADDPDLTQEERTGFENHLQECPECAQNYKESYWVLSLVKEYGTISDDTRKLLESKGIEVKQKKRPMTLDEGWLNLQRRIPELAQMEKQQKRRGIIYRVGKVAAIAASIVLVFSLGWKLLKPSQPSIPKTNTVLANFNPTAELIEENHQKRLSFGQPVTTHDQKQEIQLGQMHRMIMNTDTSVTIRADQTNGKIRYNLELTKGELYVEVVPGNPFTVKTSNAHLIITGTKFNVRYDQNRTDLALVKGSIHFGNTKNQWTDVTAGHVSTVTKQSAPTTPTQVDALAATAWVREPVAKNAVASISVPKGISPELETSVFQNPVSSFPPLESLDYDQWTQEHRDSFVKDFPWISKLEKTFQDQGINADYVTLLIISGDIWQFHYPLENDQPMATINPSGLKRIADFYQIDPAFLKEILPEAKTTLPHDPHQYQDALKHWQQDIQHAAHQPEMSTNLVFFALRATTYLNNTHTAAYLWTKTYPELAERLLADHEYVLFYSPAFSPNNLPTSQSWIGDISEKVSAIQTANTTSWELFNSPPATDCSSKYREQTQQLWDAILPLMSKMRK